MLNRREIESNLKFLAKDYAICPDGAITWDSRTWWNNETLPYLTTGTIFNEPEKVEKYRQQVLDIYQGRISEECANCSAVACKIPAFQWHEKESPITWGTPPPKDKQYFCDINQFLSKYLKL